MKIGLFGGSFNPPHLGHRRALDAFIEKIQPDLCLIIPSFVSPHKDKPFLSASFEDKMQMCRLAFESADANICFSDIERELYEKTGEKSYTYLTIDAVKEKFPAQLYLFVGSDMFFTLEEWIEAESIFKSVTVCAMKRSLSDPEMENLKTKYEKNYGAKVIILDADPIDISSTEIRKLSDKALGMTDKKVAKYIKDRKLYQKKKTREEIVALIKEKLPEKRFIHTLGVEEEALYLARLFAYEMSDEISRAALLHDLTKYLSWEEHLKLKRDLKEEDKKSPDTVHALTAAAYARDVLFESADVSLMIESHTTARKNMTLGEIIIFVADFIEKNRTYTACVEERERLHRELSEAECREDRYEVILRSAKRILEYTIEYLKRKNIFIHTKTFDALESLTERLHKE